MSNMISAYEDKMSKTIDTLNNDLATIRAGRANPHVLDKITVDYFGTPSPLNQVGNISVPEARLLQISPWDKSMLKAVEKAIQASDIGINPTNDGSVIRLVFPELTEERRKSLSKDVKKKGEDFKVAVRNVRRDGMDDLKKKQKKSEITEDDLEMFEDKLQKATDKFIAQIDKIVETKTKEIMSI
ncbi:MAG: ribosome recycling factor [Defluviitaleaceae bacterium]|nr:ribosome recycling factor [Defluviitaleaceae bacterium]